MANWICRAEPESPTGKRVLLMTPNVGLTMKGFAALTGNAGLVSDDHDRPAGPVERGDRVGRPRNEPDLVRGNQVMDVVDDDAVAVEEDRRPGVHGRMMANRWAAEQVEPSRP